MREYKELENLAGKRIARILATDLSDSGNLTPGDRDQDATFDNDERDV